MPFHKPAGSCLRAFLASLLRPIGLQNGIKMGPKWLPGGRLERLGLLEASWSGLESLLERSWMAPEPKKSAPERLLTGPRGDRNAFC